MGWRVSLTNSLTTSQCESMATFSWSHQPPHMHIMEILEQI